MSEHILTHKHQTHKHQAHNHAASGWRIHCGVEVTELSTNKQHSPLEIFGETALRERQRERVPFINEVTPLAPTKTKHAEAG
jgi:hypothetical protein